MREVATPVVTNRPPGPSEPAFSPASRNETDAPPPLARDVARFGSHPQPPAPPRPRRRSSRLGRAVRTLFLIAIVMVVTAGYFNQPLVDSLTRHLPLDNVRDTAQRWTYDAVSLASEKPAFSAASALPIADYPVCDGVRSDDAKRLDAGMDLMRGTDEGERLFDQLGQVGVCVRAEQLNYNTGYAYATQSPDDGSWAGSYIAIDQDVLRSGETDVLAALLVHESTHIDRYVHHQACNYTDSCTVLPNGVDVEEEIAAHGAEAQWWIDAYGSNGKRFATGYDYGENRLVAAYIEGPEVFRAYVIRIRSDHREGSFS